MNISMNSSTSKSISSSNNKSSKISRSSSKSSSKMISSFFGKKNKKIITNTPLEMINEEPVIKIPKRYKTVKDCGIDVADDKLLFCVLKHYDLETKELNPAFAG